MAADLSLILNLPLKQTTMDDQVTPQEFLQTYNDQQGSVGYLTLNPDGQSLEMGYGKTGGESERVICVYFQRNGQLKNLDAWIKSQPRFVKRTDDTYRIYQFAVKV